METAESHLHVSTLFNVFLSEQAINLIRNSICLQYRNEDKRSQYVMLRSQARDRRMIWGMDDLVVMPTLTHVDSVTLNVVRPGGMTSRMSSCYELTTAVVDSFVTDRQEYCLWQTVNLSQLVVISITKLKGPKVICSVYNVAVNMQPPWNHAPRMAAPCGPCLLIFSTVNTSDCSATFQAVA